MGLEDVWDKITEEWDYLISGEIFSDIGEFFSGIFDGLTELSPIGAVYGTVMVFLVYIFRSPIFVSMEHLSTTAKFFWIPIFYIFAFGIGYIMGRKVWE